MSGLCGCRNTSEIGKGCFRPIRVTVVAAGARSAGSPGLPVGYAQRRALLPGCGPAQDRDEILNSGSIPIHGPGVYRWSSADGEAQCRRWPAAAHNRGRRRGDHGTLQFIGAGTAPDEEGSVDLQYVLAAARRIGEHMTDDKVIVDRSTVPEVPTERGDPETVTVNSRRGGPGRVSAVTDVHRPWEG